MKTIYIDVYFLINFSVDLLALYFAAMFMKIRATNLRLVLAALVGALYAVIGVLLIDVSYIMYPVASFYYGRHRGKGKYLYPKA